MFGPEYRARLRHRAPRKRSFYDTGWFRVFVVLCAVLGFVGAAIEIYVWLSVADWLRSQ